MFCCVLWMWLKIRKSVTQCFAHFVTQIINVIKAHSNSDKISGHNSNHRFILQNVIVASNSSYSQGIHKVSDVPHNIRLNKCVHGSWVAQQKIVCPVIDHKSKRSNVSRRAKLALLSGGENGIPLSPVNQTDTSQSGLLWTHVWGKGQIALSSECVMLPWKNVYV